MEIVTVNLSNYYWYFKSVVPPRICDDIIRYGLSQAETFARTGGYGDNRELTKQEIKNIKRKRNSDLVWLSDTWIYKELQPYIHLANKNAGWNYDILGCENAQFTTYNAPGGFYGWHNDGGSCHHSVYKRHIPGVTDTFVDESLKKVKSGYTMNNDLIGSVRKLSVTISLTDSSLYEGGNLKFDLGENADVENRFIECTEIRPQGSIIVFPSYNIHQVTPVTKGTRYSLVIWYYGRPFR